MDERTPEERPPWEPKTRREIEQEVDSTKALKRQLGDSVAWIVDVLLQSEDTGDANQEKIDKLRQRKQGALESLAYVRDVLQGNVTSLEDDRLWDEEELAKRRAPSVPAIIPVPTLPPVRPAVVAPQMAASASLPASSGVPPAPKRVSSSFTSSRFNAQTPTSPFMPRFSPPAPLPMSPPSSNTPVPDVSSPGAMPLARWAYTKSDFSAPSSTVLPPQPTRTALQRTQTPVTTTKVLPVPQAVLSKPSGDGLSSSKQGRQEVNHDPLGALR
jgi:TBC1 domain family protein 5